MKILCLRGWKQLGRIITRSSNRKEVRTMFHLLQMVHQQMQQELTILTLLQRAMMLPSSQQRVEHQAIALLIIQNAVQLLEPSKLLPTSNKSLRRSRTTKCPIMEPTNCKQTYTIFTWSHLLIHTRHQAFMQPILSRDIFLLAPPPHLHYQNTSILHLNFYQQPVKCHCHCPPYHHLSFTRICNRC